MACLSLEACGGVEEQGPRPEGMWDFIDNQDPNLLMQRN